MTGSLAPVEARFEGRVGEVESLKDTASDQGFVYKVEVLTPTGNFLEICYDALTGRPIALGGKGFID